MKVIHIVWRDACGDDGWASRAQVEREELVRIETVGFLVRESEEAYTLTMADDHENEKVGAFMVIPKVNVVSKKYLKV